MNRKRLACDVDSTSATHANLVHDVMNTVGKEKENGTHDCVITASKCWVFNNSTHGCFHSF